MKPKETEDYTSAVPSLAPVLLQSLVRLPREILMRKMLNWNPHFVKTIIPVALSMITQKSSVQDADGLISHQVASAGAQLLNSKMLIDLSSLTTHLTETQRANVAQLLKHYPAIFGDVSI